MRLSISTYALHAAKPWIRETLARSGTMKRRGMSASLPTPDIIKQLYYHVQASEAARRGKVLFDDCSGLFRTPIAAYSAFRHGHGGASKDRDVSDTQRSSC